MIQFNLLPDVKLEYIKARRTKHLVTLVSFIITGVSVGLVVILFIVVNVVQRRHLANLNDDIKTKTSQLDSEADIDKILIVQNQLNSLNGLHDAKPAAERLGPYLSQVTPATLFVSSLKVDFAANTMTLDGDAKDIKSVNLFIDTMKFTTFGEETKNAFTGVVLASVGRSDQEGQSDQTPVSYQITLGFDPGIFDIRQTVELNVPDKITTRSVTEKPGPLFQQQSEQGGQ